MLRVCLLIFFILHSSNSHAKLKIYYCANSTDQKSCSGSCVNENKLNSWDFLVNSNKNVILKNSYKNNVLIESEPLDHCSVVDSKNWVCNLMGWGRNSVIKDRKLGTMTMSNGVYFYQSEGKPVVANNIWCMK